MKNTIKAIAIVIAFLACLAAVGGAAFAGLYFAFHGHGRLVGALAGILTLSLLVWGVKSDLDTADRRRKQRNGVNES